MAANPKEQRIRDPVHGLIVFSKNDPFDQLIWRLINTREFQRLRRIKQLGFSELVYPGATHTRFSHSLGVFHTARTLVRVIQRILEKQRKQIDQSRARISICAALLHDIGHGPFSHAFEDVLLPKKKHEDWTVEIIKGETEVCSLLDNAECFPGLREGVADLLGQKQPTDIYSSIVSSQFDADRLDYLRRDKLFTGTEQGGFDWDWLLNNLDIADITIGVDGKEDPFQVTGLVLEGKAQAAAEGYLLGRFHLYTQVYFHKTTRGAEKMLRALLRRLAIVLRSEPESAGLPENHPLRRYFSDQGQTLRNYLEIDDTTIWGALPLLRESKQSEISGLANRLLSRVVYQCKDIGELARIKGGDSRSQFKLKLSEARRAGEFSEFDVLVDEGAKISAYGRYDYESPEAFKKVLIKKANGDHDDLEAVSTVVDSLKDQDVYRVYGSKPEVMEKLKRISREAGLTWT